MRQYKQQLRSLSQVYGNPPFDTYSEPIAAFAGLLSSMHIWHQTINDTSIAQIEEECSNSDDSADHEAAALELQRSLGRCTDTWEEVRAAMRRFRFACDDEFFREAERLYLASKSWADDVVDGLWPSTHPGADDHNDVWECEEQLIEYAGKRLGIDEEELLSLASRAWHESSERLGGTGKRF